MPFDYSRKALYRPEELNPFATDQAGPRLVDGARELTLRQAWYFSNLSHCAYLDREPLTEVLDRVNLELVRFMDHDGTQGFLARGQDHAVLAFRGTEADDPKDLKRDLDAILVTHPSGGKVHPGFFEGVRDMRPELSQILDGLAGLPVWFTGHSLGAGLATVAAVQRPPAGLVTFGSPRVGDQAFVDRLAAVPTWRYVDGSDIVTELPPRVVYRHVGTMVFVSETGPARINPSAGYVRWHQFKSNLRYALRFPLFRGDVVLRSLVDHAIVNYTAAIEKDLHAGIEGPR